MNSDPVIRIERLYKEYVTEAGTVPVLKDVSVSVMPGEFVAIMGPSGSGKSTFMNILGCLDVATSGNYFLNGRDVNAQSRDELALLRNQVIGFVFQGFNLLPRASLEDNVALPLIYRGTPTATRLARASEMLEKVGLGQYRRSRPNQISGGQQQRVAIARALVNHPKLLLADEPTGNLDTHTSQEIMALFTELNQRDGITIVLITHESDIATYAQRLVRLSDGRIVYDGAIEHAAPHHLEATS
ncbi:ABC transporter ATP-binding protein [Sideroxydans lithotrophicus]|uniref:ABC transporter related protein n=1 Tax=Sideroxydans lithotrophicus (strain ES-1) TaxID=580332 RepID=D5CRZ0_SIDLE|nr:ABC transporter ATP-binding protein [Sideroxydans lithotrophicus]ADE11726.1 ABC transporter related protein [Sideroxydans lithotrophicus ES-1]